MYIVIGATSFIGVYTVDELLSHGCSVLVTGRNNKFREYYEKKNVDYVNLDLTNDSEFDHLPKKGVEAVILLGGLLPANSTVNLNEDENSMEYININVEGTIRVLEYCRKNGIKRVISTTTYADVKNLWSETALTEDAPRNFEYSGDHAMYTISKNAACDILEYYNQQHGMSNAWFRFPPVYGVGPHGSLFVNGLERKSGLQTFIDKAKNGEEIIVFGDRNLSRDVVYVKDVARAFYLALLSNKTKGLYNMTSGKGTTLQEQAIVIAELFAPSAENVSEISYDSGITNATSSFLFSMDKAKRDFNFVPKFSDFRLLMKDYKSDLDNKKYHDLFKYPI